MRVKDHVTLGVVLGFFGVAACGTAPSPPARTSTTDAAPPATATATATASASAAPPPALPAPAAKPVATDDAELAAATDFAGMNNAFGVRLFSVLRKNEGNLLFSPTSISTALGMTYAGAKGKTASE